MNRLGIKTALVWAFVLAIVGTASARYPDSWKTRLKDEGSTSVSGRSDCVQGSSRYDMQLNNVRATLLSSGDVWWDLQNGSYIVPKVLPGTGTRAVSSIFAGAVWLGGKDPLGNLKVAVQTYRSATRTDFWPGPLTEAAGTTNAETCERWDKHFIVTRVDIDSMLKLLRRAREIDPNNPVIECGLVPESLKGWPAAGNPYFFEIHRFTLPRRAASGLAKFHDEDGDGQYDPCKGDYPTIDVKGCNIDVYPDEMVFWIYNDNGGVHTQSQRSTPIQMEVQVQAFSYQTNDELNDMTFQRYKLINRARTDIDSMYFAMWVDFDLGCYTDDYIGCDTSRSLAYCYNQDATDGTTGNVCDGGVATYGTKIPIIGVDYFRGPNDEFGNELGMSSFTYYLNGSVCNPLPGTTDPNTAAEYYNYLTGKWRDGTPYTYGGSGYAPGGAGRQIKFAFVDNPDNNAGWSMCSANLPCGDRRTIQATGPLKLKPGAINELIVGVPWVADQKYPCPDIRNLQQADDLAQALFDNCFKIFDGPDAPDMTFVELNKEIVAVLSNAPESNNFKEEYKEKGLKIPARQPDSLYRFQGYKLYQLRDGEVGIADLENPDKARLVAQVDIQDSVSRVYNWSQLPDPNFPGRLIFTPNLKVEGENKGIRHTFKITEDKFATGDDKRLVNHKKYYFTTIAYAYNNYELFDEKFAVGQGQREPYVVGRRNIGDKNRGNKPYEVIPRPIVDQKLGAKYGDGPIITRVEGVGTGTNYLEISEGTLAKILSGTNDGTITYNPGKGPIDVKIHNPLEVVDGNYKLEIVDGNTADATLAANATWRLTKEGDATAVVSERTIEKLNEQVVAKYGFSISINQVDDAGRNPIFDKTNGVIGTNVIYKNPGNQWLTAVPEGASFVPGLDMLNYVKNEVNQVDFDKDPNQALGSMSNLFKPYLLCDYRFPTTEPLISPSWQNTNNATVAASNGLFNLNNVDIVLTPDKSKWSRCVVVETAQPWYYENLGPQSPRLTTEGNARNFDSRRAPSVGKNPAANGLPQGEVLPEEQALGITTGMGWFPGYAVDVETGRRLNIFFGENTAFDPNVGDYTADSKGINRDMLFNPSNQAFLNVPGFFDPGYAAFFGGHHFVYVTNSDYDSCRFIRQRLGAASVFNKISALRTVTWAGPLFTATNQKMLPLSQGLIPNEVNVQLRVKNSYAPAAGQSKVATSHPTYKFTLDGTQAQALTTKAQIDSSLNFIGVVPNPYYAYSSYEANEFTNTVKITNLPAKCVVTVYTIDGKFIRQFKRDERPTVYSTQSLLGTLAKQIAPDLEWDLKNDKGIPTSSGVYLIHVDAGELGQRTLKFLSINRQFDPSRL